MVVSLITYLYKGAEEEVRGVVWGAGEDENEESTYQPRKIPLLIPRHIIIKHRHPIRRRLENRRRPGRVRRRRGRFDLPRRFLDRGHVVNSPHTRQRIPIPATPQQLRNTIPIPPCSIITIHPETECVARMLDISAHQRVLPVSKRPVIDCDAPGGLPRDDDFVGVAAEGPDVGVEPLDGEALVAEAEVLGRGGGAGEAEDVEAEVEGGDYYVLGVGEVVAVVEGGVGGAGRVSCAEE